ncbi:MAG TPA: class I SAM-dependent methyltransferase [Gemmatimonadaceae bacterium]|nr:class I SAM-dependent methyltransferase [Gemmatimonadaceae bacterium]
MSAAERLEELDALDAQLDRRFRVIETRVPTPPTVGAGAPPEIVLKHPASAEELIVEEAFERDERLPYWADIWPSAVALSGRLVPLAERYALRRPGARALELGCGVGLVTTVLAFAGFDVVATDYYDDALHFARLNAGRNAGAAIETRNVDWRDFPNDLGRFDLVVASDVLYERPYAALVAHAIHRSLAPDGVAIIADPGRVAADAFVAECRSRGLRVEWGERVPFVDGEIRQAITLYEITRPQG